MFQQIIDYLTANVTLVGLLVGALIPPVTSIVQQPAWSKATRQGVAVVVSVVFGALTAAAAGDISDPSQVVPTIVAVLLSAEATYQKVWKPSGATAKIEKATSPSVDNADL